MSKRRQGGEWVWLSSNAGFVGESNRLKVKIQPEDGDWEPCLLDCGDDDCREWCNCWTEPDSNNGDKRHCLPHVSECQMHDEPQKS